MAVGPGGYHLARGGILNHVPAAVPQGLCPAAVVAGDNSGLHFLLCSAFVQVLYHLRLDEKYFKLFCDRDALVTVQRVGGGIDVVRPLFFFHHRAAPASDSTGLPADGGVLDGETGRNLFLRHTGVRAGGDLYHICGQILRGETTIEGDGQVSTAAETCAVGDMQRFQIPSSADGNIFGQLCAAVDVARTVGRDDGVLE